MAFRMKVNRFAVGSFLNTLWIRWTERHVIGVRSSEIGAGGGSFGCVILSKTTLGLWGYIPVFANPLKMFFSVKDASYDTLNIG